MAKDDAQKTRQDYAKGYKPETVLDETADKRVFMADIGTTVTSHGDGTHTVAPDLVERAKEIKAFNADPDRENRAVAERLQRGEKK
ncbi:MAG: hypothetical protein M3R38_01850 [Actinomycetota bacterium]|nr:hypothetical protein [Actinomycetota bacterium]